MRRLKDIGELNLIARFRNRYKTYSHTIDGIGDDTAVICFPGGKDYLLFTCDTLVSGVHFPKRKKNWYEIGWKALGAGLSDIAAMGGIPTSALISLALPRSVKVRDVDDFIKGVNSLARRFAVDIVGGDTVSSPRDAVITVAVIGRVSPKKIVRRKGAQPGDQILVTGRLGASRFQKQFNFIPRIKEAQWLIKHARINAMIDITDGLTFDLRRIINASRAGAIIYEDSIPIASEAFQCRSPLKSALNDGEDFELLIISPDAEKLTAQWKDKRVPLSIIGRITAETGKIRLRTKAGGIKEIIPSGYEHFK